jgi:hypothetical protein
MTKTDYMERIHALPCVICWKKLGCKTYGVHAHHAGEPTERNDWALIPLCEFHHTGPVGIHGLQRRGFYRFWKTSNTELLAWTNEANAKY